MDVTEAIKTLKEGKKRKFTQTYDLIVNLHNFDVRKEALNTFISVPHPTEKKVAAFLTKHSKVVPTITENEFAKYNDPKAMKKLANDYDFFIAVAPMMSKIATKFGRVFGPAGKMPSPQGGIIPKDDDEIVKEMKDKMQKMIRIRTKELSIKIPVGKEDMKDSDIQENVEAVITELEHKLPRGKDCIKNAMLKLTMTKPIKFLDNVSK